MDFDIEPEFERELEWVRMCEGGGMANATIVEVVR
jgi:hypothetical protein